MKRIVVFVFAVLVGFANVSLANIIETHDSSPKLIMQSGQQELLLSLDMGDLNSRSEAEITNEIKEFLLEGLSGMEADLNCKVSVKGKVNVGVASVEITVEVSGPCSLIRSQGTEIANQILREIRTALQKT